MTIDFGGKDNETIGDVTGLDSPGNEERYHISTQYSIILMIPWK